MIELFHKTSEDCSEIVTQNYSTSFCSAIRLLHKDLHVAIFNIYGFVRLVDEIVDSFHDHDKQALLDKCKQETYQAIEQKISLNPILNSFQRTVNEYQIDLALVDAFFSSMQMDLSQTRYSDDSYKEYIYGSAEVVGLMCLYVFCEGDKQSFNQLKKYARSLGAAFQKVNFLRDIKSDYYALSRVYFPFCDFNNFTESDKIRIEQEIEDDFENAYEGIVRLPGKARFGVYVAYCYYLSLFKKIKRLKPAKILEQRVRIPNYQKLMIILRAGLKNQISRI